MHVWLQVAAGRSVGQQFHLRGGQLARFGRSDWADYSFPNDSAMDDIQFEVRVDQHGPRLRHNGKQGETLVNGDPVEEVVIRHGDQVAAGETTFSVFVEGEVLEPTDDSASQAEEPTDPMHLPIDTVGLSRYLELDEEALEHAAAKQTPAQFIEKLQAQAEFPAAVRVQAHFLPKPQAVLWGATCVREVFGDELPAADAGPLATAEKWANQPTDQDRLAAGRAAEAAQYDGAAASLCLAAFCSEGNIGHPDHDPVLADERITGNCVAVALVQAAYWGDPRLSEERFRAFLVHELLAWK